MRLTALLWAERRQGRTSPAAAVILSCLLHRLRLNLCIGAHTEAGSVSGCVSWRVVCVCVCIVIRFLAKRLSSVKGDFKSFSDIDPCFVIIRVLTTCPGGQRLRTCGGRGKEAAASRSPSRRWNTRVSSHPGEVGCDEAADREGAADVDAGLGEHVVERQAP